jgi:hypothetical protein
MQTTGNDSNADRIRQANATYVEPLPPGVTIQIPSDPREISAIYPKELEIKVWGQKIGTFTDFELVSQIDAIQKGSFTVPNEKILRSLFVPLSTPRITVSANYELLLTGRCYSPNINNTADSKMIQVGFYSEPGILETSGPPIASFPLEFKKMNLQQIASELCWKHAIPTIFNSDSGGWFKQVSIEPGVNTLDFLADLARQRGSVITSTADGELLFQTGAIVGKPVSKLEKGFHPCESVNISFDESQYYSSVTGYVPRKSKPGYHGKGFTIENPYKTDVIRPLCQEIPDVDEGELEKSTNALAGRMFASAVSVSVEVSSWTDDNSELYKPNTTLLLKSPDDYIEDFYEFLISNVSLKKNSESTTASINLVLPGVYSGKVPEKMPWQ